MAVITGKQFFNGVLTLILVGLLGTTIYLVDTGNNRSCKTGWNFVTDGDYEGQYSCEARPEVYYYCFDIRNSVNTEDYWCDEAEIVKIIEPDLSDISIPSGISYTTTESCLIKGDYCYCNPRGSLDNKQLC